MQPSSLTPSKTNPHPVFPSDAKGQPSLPHSLKPANTMVVRLIPASEAMSNALKSYRYCPLLEVPLAPPAHA